jgi:GrpB-like predicted nucleotidyltransferase (UPF0157 family)
VKFFKPHHFQAENEFLFIQYKTRLLMALPDAQIEHIGASSIPGSLSKGNLDIYIAVDSEQHEQAISIIKEFRFVSKSDGLPTGLCILENGSVVIQLVKKGIEFEYFLNFRDALKKNHSLLQKYNHLKYFCTGLIEEDYHKMKSLFIEDVLKKL